VGAIFPETDYGIRLRALLAFDYIELDLIALFERFVPVQLNCRVVNEYIRPVFASDESVALGVVEPLDLPFVLSHRFLPSFSFSCGSTVRPGRDLPPILGKTPEQVERLIKMRAKTKK
jgi:hypothetical protein